MSTLGMVTRYRSRVWSEYAGCMVEIAGRNGLHLTAANAIHFAQVWNDIESQN